jgi:hypothetical protein
MNIRTTDVWKILERAFEIIGAGLHISTAALLRPYTLNPECDAVSMTNAAGFPRLMMHINK